MRGVTAVSILLAAAPSILLSAAQDAGYLEPGKCAVCHREISETYRGTGMARSFYRLSPETAVEDYSRNNTYYHEASDQHFKMFIRDGRYFERRHQVAPDGREVNAVEKEIRYVLGSGNHARTYLSITPAGQLEQTPVGWYAEKGGYWAMNPGYDQADHMDFRRKIDQECFFCHNAYPEQESGASIGARELFLRGAIPEGIDCQRCHGPGRAH